MKQPSRQACRGFTRTELLVVIVAIGVLAGLIDWPRPWEIRESARRIQCLNNLKQIGEGLQMYYEDNSAAPPSFASTNFWPYIGSTSKPLRCPSDSSKPWTTNMTQFVSNLGLYCSYWYLPSKIPETNWPTPVAWDRGVCEPSGPWPVKSPHKGDGANVLWSDGHVDWNRKFPTNHINTVGIVRFE